MWGERQSNHMWILPAIMGLDAGKRVFVFLASQDECSMTVYITGFAHLQAQGAVPVLLPIKHEG